MEESTLESGFPAAGPALSVAPDAAVLNRLQQENQRRIVGKLLHDLRNPVHSIRISMELFGRIVRRDGDFDKLMERAGLYIEPAEAAVASLVANCERLARYLAPAAAPDVQTLRVDELLTEATSLWRAARRQLQVTSALPDPPTLALRADRTRLCHVLLHAGLDNAAAALAVSVRSENGMVALDLTLQGSASDTSSAAALRPDELRLIIETAGGALIAASETGLSMTFMRASDPPAGG